MEHFEANGAMIEYQVQGSGEPVLLIDLSLNADGLGRPLLSQPELASHYRLIHYHRRGYMGSTLGFQPLTASCQASDAAALLQHLGVSSAHIVGHSFGGTIALQLAGESPELVHSLALLEPALRMVPNGGAYMGRLFAPIMEAYRSGNKGLTVELIGNGVYGPNWQPVVEKAIPGGVDQALRDVDTFMQELPAIQEWQFGAKQAAAIRQPVLSVLGLEGSPFMKEGRTLIHAWFPQAEDLDVPTNHLLQMKDPHSVARGLTAFFSRHPIV